MLEALEARWVPALIQVTTLKDVLDPPASPLVSLRAAIALANNNGPGNDVINIRAGLPGSVGRVETITLAGKRMNITSSITINGPGAGLLKLQGKGDQIFNIARGTVVVSGMELTGATDAAVVVSAGATATFNKCTWSKNSATATRSTRSGAAILNQGSLTLTDCTFTSNTATQGGALFNNTRRGAPAAKATITNCTFFGNRATDGGGALFNAAGTLTLTNVTVTNNLANSDNVASRIDKGGGMHSGRGAVTHMQNTVIAGNFTGRARPDDINGAVSSASRTNFVGVDANGGLGISHADARKNQVGTVANPLDPRLGPLQNNKGPTATCAMLYDPANAVGGIGLLGTGSAGRDATFAAPPKVDQRGLARARTPDIGAFESQVGLFLAPVAPILMRAGQSQKVLGVGGSVGAVNNSISPQLTILSSNQVLFPNINSALDANGDLVLTPVGIGSATITIIVSDPVSKDNQRLGFTVTVMP